MLLRLLEDGAWQPFEETYAKLLGAVAPGKALRRYAQIEAARVRSHGPRKGPGLSEQEQIASGRRSIATDTVNSMKKRHVELAWTAAGRMMRRRETPLPVSDSYRVPPPASPPPASPSSEPPSEPAPATVAAPPNVAFFSEAQVRQILRDVVEEVVDAALDRFQHGMRGFLLGRFADLERLLHRDCRQHGVPGPAQHPYPHERDGASRRNH